MKKILSTLIAGALEFALSGGNKIIAGASALTSGFYAGVKSNETGEICICGAYKKIKKEKISSICNA